MTSKPKRILNQSIEALKPVAKDIADTFNPENLLEQILGLEGKSSFNNKEDMRKHFAKKGASPLEPKYLQEKYQEKDNEKIRALRIRLHKRRQEEEKSAWERRKKEEQQKKLQQQREENRRRQKEEEERQSQPLIEPKGKTRRSIFAPIKRKIQQLMPEYRGNKSRG